MTFFKASPGQSNIYITNQRRINNLESDRDNSSIKLNIIQLKLDQQKRITKRDNAVGSVIQNFNSIYDNNNDLLEMSLTASTGNIDGNITGNTVSDLGRLDNLARFYSIMDIASDDTVINGNEFNYVVLGITSPVLRSTQILNGWFKAMPSIHESAESPQCLEFEMSFWIVDNTRISWRKLFAELNNYGSSLGG